LSWSENSTNEDGFQIERCAGAGCASFAKIAETGANATSYIDTPVSSSTSYSYRVRAFNAGGGANDSNIATVTTPAAPQVALHIGDLEGSTASSKNTWTASVTITVHNASEAMVQGATVSGNWSNGFSGSASCTTASNGTCKVTTGNLNKSKTSVTFTVTNVTRSDDTYASSSNHETSITILKP